MVVPHKEHNHWFMAKGFEYLVHDLVVRYLDSHDQEDDILLVSISVGSPHEK